MASCKEFIRQMKDPRSIVNCGSCVKYNRKAERCREEDELLDSYGIKRYEDTPNYADFKRMMEDSKSILIT